MPQLVSALFGRPPQNFAGPPRPFYMVARPGFFGGFGSWLDIFTPLMWNYGLIPEQDEYDSAIIRLDWEIVGMDMTAAIGLQAETNAA